MIRSYGGNYIPSQIGVYMDQVQKEKGIDGKVVIENDVWIGSDVMILCRVHIHRFRF